MDRRCLCDHFRGLLDAGRQSGRPLRPAQDVRAGPAPVRAGLTGRWHRERPHNPDRGPRRARPRRRFDGGLLAGGDHLFVRARTEAQPRDRCLGGDERTGRRGGNAVRGTDHPRAELALGAADQPPDRDRGGRNRLLRGERAPQRSPGTHLRSCGRPDTHDRPDGPRIRCGRSRPGRLGHDARRSARSSPASPCSVYSG